MPRLINNNKYQISVIDWTLKDIWPFSSVSFSVPSVLSCQSTVDSSERSPLRFGTKYFLGRGWKGSLGKVCRWEGNNCLSERTRGEDLHKNTFNTRTDKSRVGEGENINGWGRRRFRGRAGGGGTGRGAFQHYTVVDSASLENDITPPTGNKVTAGTRAKWGKTLV